MKRIIQAVSLAVVISIVLIVIKNNGSYLLIQSANYGMPALVNKGDINNLFIGSSMFRQGLDIETLEENEEDNYILAYNGNQPYLEYYQLLNLIDKGVKIKHLYIDMYAYSLWADPKISDEKMLMEFSLMQKKQLLKNITCNNLGEKVHLLWQTYVSSNNELILTWPISGRMVNGIFYKGGNISKPAGAEYEILETMQVNQIQNEMNVIQKEYLIKLIDLAKDNNISIVFVETPKYRTTMLDDSYQTAMKQYMNLLDDSGILYIINSNLSMNRATYEYENEQSDYFVDTVHLSYEGRVSFTNILCTKLDELHGEGE